MRHTRAIMFLTLLAAVTSGGTAPAHASAAYTGSSKLKGVAAQMDSFLAILTRKGQFMGTVLVARKGKVLLKKGYGGADYRQGIKNTASTQFLIGSITKQFTAAAIMQLQEKGKLSVQDPICKYLPACPDGWKPITLHMLLTHTSGIPDFPSRGTDVSQSMKIEDIIARLQSEPLDFVPGSRWSYSNSGYDLLGYVIQKVSGESWATYLQQNIFDPLALKHTGAEATGSLPPDLATGYSTILNSTLLPAGSLDPSLIFSAGELYSTVGDLYTWDASLLADRVASKASTDALFTPYVPLAPGSTASYGYGWILTTLSSHRVIFHDGSLPGFESVNILAPDDGLTAIVLSNDGTADSTDIGLVLTDYALGINPGI